jgi:1,4-dihydroxy-2-naphthoate octaprenyltransferase
MKDKLKWLYYSQFWIAVMAMALSSYYQLVNQLIDFNYYRMVFVGVSTWSAYLLLNILGANNDEAVETQRLIWVREHRIFLTVLCALTSLVTAVMFIGLLESDLIIAGICVIIVLFYEKFFPKLSLRTIPYLKTPLICTVWALMCTYFASNHANFLQFVDCFIFVMALMIPFDLRDTEVDATEGTENFVAKLGPEAAKLYGLALLGGSALFQASYFGMDFRNVLIEFILLGMYFGIVRKVQPNHNDQSLYLGVDSLMMVRLLHFLVAS